MGFRCRKSINLGGGFRINISKSGIGYSWGTKGYRITKTAKGTTRQTLSIPGTGLSYVEETRAPKSRGTEPLLDSGDNHYNAQDIKNADASEMISDGLKSIVTQANNVKSTKATTKSLSIACLILCISFLFCLFGIFKVTSPSKMDIFILTIPTFLFGVLSITFGVIAGSNKGVQLDYAIDKDAPDSWSDTLTKIAKSKKIWNVVEGYKNSNTKVSSGCEEGYTADEGYECSISLEIPFPFRVKGVRPLSIKLSKNETLLFLPDALFIFQGNEIGALSKEDVSMKLSFPTCVCHNEVPEDAEIIDYEWEYVNKNGGPDKRFKNNRQLPVCKYGLLEITSSTGLNTKVMFSNPRAFEDKK